MNNSVDYPIDYEAYSTEEIIDLADFLGSLEHYHVNKVATNLIEKYQRFQEILNNKTEEKRIDLAFEKATGVSIFQTMKTIKEGQ